MDCQIEEFITKYLEWQVTHRGKGEGVLAAWKEVFAPQSSSGDSSTSKYFAIRKSQHMKSLALFFDKGDAFTCVPTVGDCESDKTCIKKDFSSFFDVFMYISAYSNETSNKVSTFPRNFSCEVKLSSTKEQLKISNIPSNVKKTSNKGVMKNLATTSNVSSAETGSAEACEDNELHKRDLLPHASVVAGESLHSSSKKLKFESVVTQTESSETLAESDLLEPDGNKQSMHPNYRLKAALWDQRFQELATLWDGYTTVYQNHISTNRSLTNWVKHQRKCFKRGLVSEERMSKLQSIGFKWVGRNSVVLSKQPQDEFELAAAKQAFSVNAARQKQLLDDRNDAWSALWDTRFKELVEYKKRFGDTKVPKDWSENKKLAGWVRKQREQVSRRVHNSVL